MSFLAEFDSGSKQVLVVEIMVPAEINGQNVGFLHDFDRFKMSYTDILRPAASGPGPRINAYWSGIVTSSMQLMKLDSGSFGGKAPHPATPAPKMDPKEVKDRKKHDGIIKSSLVMKRIGPAVSVAFPKIKSGDGKTELVSDMKTKRSVMKDVLETVGATKPQPTNGSPAKDVSSGHGCTKCTQKFSKASELETHKKTHR
ncbi:hypothetical protein DHEL01_v210683 [Diaporthe helianthi]|uniref:C2H2-type domain-containing protein n=1 Tax=Diaporthe helianthi TaxID=158607 RepID=A0A2P5HKZ9_DIAHE|nr:hypothetical protein DHEL01_v210683 [Diaporthe helianthi]